MCLNLVRKKKKKKIANVFWKLIHPLYIHRPGYISDKGRFLFYPSFIVNNMNKCWREVINYVTLYRPKLEFVNLWSYLNFLDSRIAEETNWIRAVSG
jgi:hypothetical protein